MVDMKRLLHIKLHGNDVRGFLNEWRKTVYDLGARRPPQDFLKTLFTIRLEPVPFLASVWKRFDDVPPGHPDRRYNTLINKIETILANKQKKSHHEQEMSAAGSGKNDIWCAAPVTGTQPKGKGKGRKKKGNGKGGGGKIGNGTHPDQGICFKFLKGECTDGKDCKRDHDTPFKNAWKAAGEPFLKAKKAVDAAKELTSAKKDKGGGKGGRGKGRGGKRSSAPAEKLTREQMAVTPCPYLARGACNMGDKCWYKHNDGKSTSTAAPSAQSLKDKAKNILYEQSTKKAIKAAENAAKQAQAAAKPKADAKPKGKADPKKKAAKAAAAPVAEDGYTEIENE